MLSFSQAGKNTSLGTGKTFVLEKILKADCGWKLLSIIMHHVMHGFYRAVTTLLQVVTCAELLSLCGKLQCDFYVALALSDFDIFNL